MKYIYPKNKRHFIELIKFAKQVLSICDENDIPCVIYGSFSHFYHTKDLQMKVNDIDILIPFKQFPKMYKILNQYKIKNDYHPDWGTIILHEGQARLELDSPGTDYKEVKEKTLGKEGIFEKIDFYGMPAKIITTEQLEDIYAVAYNRSRDDKVKIMKRIVHFQSFLGREIKYKVHPKKIEVNEGYWKKGFDKLSKDLDFKYNINPSGKHLDFGCGIGIFCKILSENYPNLKVTGMDINKDEIIFSNSKYSNKNAQFIYSNKINDKYTSISAFVSLHEIKSPINQLNEFRKHLAKKGKLFVTEFKKTTKEVFRKMYESNGNPNKGTFEEEYKEHNRWTIEEFERMCKKVGFKTIKIKPLNKYFLAYVGEK